MPIIMWVPGTDFHKLVITSSQQSFALADIQGLAHHLGEKLDMMLKNPELTCGIGDITSVFLDALGGDTKGIRDDMQKLSAGYCFLNDPLNKLRDLETAIARSILSASNIEESYLVRSISPDGSIAWDHDGIKKWMGLAKEVLTTMFVLIHLTSGQPARGEELSLIHITNTLHTTRNIYWSQAHDRMIIVTSYVKSRERTHHDNYIARFLPESLSKQLAAYLAIIRPLEKLFICELYGQDKMESCRHHLFIANGKPINGSTLRYLFMSRTQKFLGKHVTFNQYRHCAIAFARQLIKNNDRGNPSIDWQAGHSEYTATLEYARSDHDLSYLDPMAAHGFYLASKEWQDLIYGSSTILAVGKDKDMQLQQQGRDKAKQEVAHYLALLEMRSQIMQRNLMLESALLTRPETGLTGSMNMIPSHGIQPGNIFYCKALEGLHEYLGDPSATFTSSTQCTAIAAAIEGVHSIMCVLPTGAGKSLVFAIPALMQAYGKITVIVVPLAALVLDHVDNLNARGIPCMIWHKNSTCKLGIPNTMRIVVVSVEAAISTEFINALQVLHDTNRLERIVVDEAHLAITWNDFRPDMLDLILLRKVPTQLILLSATIPPHDIQGDLVAAFGTRFDLVLREPTYRPKLKYHIQWHDSDTLMRDALVKQLQSFETSIANSERGLVFVTSRDKAESLVKDLETRVPWTKAQYYHGKISDDKKKDVLKAWKTGECKVVVATCAFGIGIDFKEVRFVMHLAGSSSVLDYIQETGRAGRDGTNAECILFANRKAQVALNNMDVSTIVRQQRPLYAGKKELAAILLSGGCIRKLLQAKVDENPKTCIV
ncbi:hypothetical protein O0I10_013105 [Lichtheimia ornata]|uniref:DNA 3'-5' helicase n=1 Tax=Lichtheimia ornata TaxID=688661 RepID=A0AAD7UQP1_9FUNG|nr:uncharacterized protein O0I10_013105 [Lichtheimia ornata]KAJ8651373.1 hypothetical protein O0I10_013105 [Lichtheimia ornata]